MTWFSVLFLVCRYYCLKNCCIFGLQRQSQSVALASRIILLAEILAPIINEPFAPFPALLSLLF